MHIYICILNTNTGPNFRFITISLKEAIASDPLTIFRKDRQTYGQAVSHDLCCFVQKCMDKYCRMDITSNMWWGEIRDTWGEDQNSPFSEHGHTVHQMK